MTEPSKRAQNKRDRRDRILKAAIEVFAQTGYSGASMNAIATCAGLTKPTLYQYFPSKDALFQAILAAPRDEMLLAFDAPDRVDMVALLYQFAWRYASVAMRPEYLSLARLIIGEAHRFPAIGRDYQSSGPNKVLAGMMGFMCHHRDAGRLGFDDAELAAEDFWGLILSAPRNLALHVPDADIGPEVLARYINNGLAVFLRAYSTSPATDLATLARVIADPCEARNRNIDLFMRTDDGS